MRMGKIAQGKLEKEMRIMFSFRVAFQFNSIALQYNLLGNPLFVTTLFSIFFYHNLLFSSVRCNKLDLTFWR